MLKNWYTCPQGGSVSDRLQGAMISGMPRVGPSIVRRPHLEDWLGRFSSVPVRFLVAPPGFGKTMALVGYLRNSAPNGFYCLLAANCTAEQMWTAIAHALEAEGEFPTHEEVVRALAARAPL